MVCRCGGAHRHSVLSPSRYRALATVVWGLVFTAINLYQIARLYLERRPVVLSNDEQKLYDLGFRSLRPRKFVSLSLVGEWKSAEPGERVVTEGQPATSVCISISGSADVCKQDQRVGTLDPGNIIGSGLALSGDPSPVEVTFIEPARYMRWSLPSLRTFMDRRPDLRVTLQSLVNRDLAGKLDRLMS
ncbi:MAG TPA: cyclic nucleotide-binding domain-containing protein [Candidatus Polarisedimenticolaceae bacterium]|nr:cyclic nucleotide-binding domain-containing protein [Candidatus Polarisedimenticolaceae bacterium]